MASHRVDVSELDVGSKHLSISYRHATHTHTVQSLWLRAAVKMYLCEKLVRIHSRRPPTPQVYLGFQANQG